MHETLRLLLQPPRSLCASTGHFPHLPSREAVQPATARDPWSRDNFPGRTHGAPQAGATSRWPLPPQARPTSVPLPPPEPEWATAPESAAPFTPSCLGGNRCPQATYMQSQGQIQSWTPGAVWTKERKGNLSQQAQEQRIKFSVNLMYPASVEYLNRQQIIPKLRHWTLGAAVDLEFAFCI